MRTHFRFRKALAFLLAALMILGMAPAMALGAGAADSSTSDAFYRIVHLDCGRKYFTADWIKALITEMKAAGYTHLELAIGNDGLRFLLDDMSVTANDTTYSSAYVTAGIRSGNTTKGARTLQYWRCRLLDKTLSNTSTSGTEEQTDKEGDDDTYNGTGFTKVRYWNGAWAVYTENNEWVNVTSDHQLVAYYLEILPVAAELTVTAADWGKKGDGSTSGDYLVPSSSCTVSIQVIYEDGTTNPAGTTADDLASSTIAYGYWTGGRGVGTLNLTGLEGYQIWKIEAETGAMTYASTSATWGSFTVKSFEWDDNAVTVYEGEPVDSYIIHNNSNNPSTDGYYANLMWDENHEAILIKAYVKTVETEDTLTVHYIDNTTNQEFYNYNINVKSGITFNEGISLADPWKGALANGSVTNNLGVTQTVSADLSTMPEIGAQYRYSEYTCVRVVRSADGKEVTLYYTFNNTHSFVIDFGLPLTITRADLGIEGDWTEATVAGEVYGTAEATVNAGVTYTPDNVLKGVERLTLTLTDGSDNGITHIINIIPATVVYYEEGFVTGFTGSGWTDNGTAAGGSQTTSVAGSKDTYGNDSAYGSDTGYSNGTYTTITVSNGTTEYPTANFTFTGTGFDIISRTGADQGAIRVVVTNSDGAVEQTVTVINKGVLELYQIPVISVEGLTYGEHTATITVFPEFIYNNDTNSPLNYGGTFVLDGIRIYGTLESNDAYNADGENDPEIIEVGDQLNTDADIRGTGAVVIDLNGATDVTSVSDYQKFRKSVCVLSGRILRQLRVLCRADLCRDPLLPICTRPHAAGCLSVISADMSRALRSTWTESPARAVSNVILTPRLPAPMPR